MFIFNNRFAITSATVLLLAASFGSQAVAPTSATVTFTAKVIKNTCEWDGSGTPTVQFNTVTIDGVKSGTVSDKDFHLKLKSCGTGTKVHVTATGTGMDSSGVVPNPTGAGKATNVGVSVLDDTTVLKNGIASKEFTDVSGDIDILLKAKLQKVGSADPTEGDVEIPVTINLQYN